MPDPTPERRPSLESYAKAAPLILLAWVAEREALLLGEAIRRYDVRRRAWAGGAA